MFPMVGTSALQGRLQRIVKINTFRSMIFCLSSVAHCSKKYVTGILCTRTPLVLKIKISLTHIPWHEEYRTNDLLLAPQSGSLRINAFRDFRYIHPIPADLVADIFRLPDHLAEFPITLHSSCSGLQVYYYKRRTPGLVPL